jgi:hypothetical protein
VAQAGGKVDAFALRFANRLVEGDDACAPLRLCQVHRRVGVAQNVCGRVVLRAAERDSDAHGGEHVAGVGADRFAHFGENAYSGVFRFKGPVDPVEQHGKLVAAHSRNDVLGPDAFLHPSRGKREHFIGDTLAERVVDRFEIIEFDEEHRKRARGAALDDGNGSRYVLEKRSPVGQTGERIVSGALAQVLGHGVLRGHVVH